MVARLTHALQQNQERAIPGIPVQPAASIRLPEYVPLPAPPAAKTPDEFREQVAAQVQEQERRKIALAQAQQAGTFNGQVHTAHGYHDVSYSEIVSEMAGRR